VRTIYVSLLNSGDGYFLSCRDTHKTTHLLTAMMPKEIMERIALLQLTQPQDWVEGVGMRFSQDNWDIYLPNNFTWEES
jgi:hypothetical protein